MESMTCVVASCDVMGSIGEVILDKTADAPAIVYKHHSHVVPWQVEDSAESADDEFSRVVSGGLLYG